MSSAKLLRMPDVLEAVGLSKSMIYNLIRAGKFPKPVILSVRAVAWHREDVNAFIASRQLGAATQ